MSASRSLIVCLSATLSGGCVSTSADLPPPPENPGIVLDDATCVSCGWLLSSAELSQYQRQAEAGDAEAAFRVALHYSSANDHPQHQSWMHRAARLGHAVAQYNLWFTLRESGLCSDQLEALSWLKKSAAQGVREAADQLQPFQKLAAPCQVPPNNSFKPNLLRSTKATAKKLAMALAPLRKSA